MPPGLWGPALPNILETYDALWVIPYATAIGPFVGIFSSLAFASLADRRIPAEKLFGVLALSGAGFLWLAFASLSWGWSAWFYVGFQGLNALISAPMWALLIKIALVNSNDPGRQFPLFRLWGTVGWIVAGVAVSWLSLDNSATSGMAAAFVRILLAGAAFMLPTTKPAMGGAKGMFAALGLNAFSLFKDRSLRVYFITSALIAIPWAAHYMYAPKLLKELAEIDYGGGVVKETISYLLPGPTAQMSLGQVTEIFAMLFLSWVGARARVKPLVIIALVLGVLRFTLYALAGHQGMLMWMWLGVSLHGPCYTLFSITGQMFVDRRVPDSMRGQAQALLGLLGGSIGGSVGALSCGAVFNASGAASDWMSWTIFWLVLSGLVVLCLLYFCSGYKNPSDQNLDE